MAGKTTTAHEVELTERDWQILRGLFESRIMTVAHVAALYFEGRGAAARKRAWKLKNGGYIAERPRKHYDPAILFLTSKAFRALDENGRLDGYPKLHRSQLEKRARVSEMTIRHELAVMDAKAAIISAVAKLPHLHVQEFSTWPLLSQFSARPHSTGGSMLVRPDGFLRVRENEPDGAVSEHTFFLEVDRSTEALDILTLRAACYRDHYRGGGFAEQMGQPRDQFEQFPFRVLMVFLTEERRNNIAHRLLALHPPILYQAWLTTLPELIKTPLAPIWVRPHDFQAALRQSRHALTPPPAYPYRRSTEMHADIAAAVVKHFLFEGRTS